MNKIFLYFTIPFLFICSIALAQNATQDKELNYAIIKDSKDSILEGYIINQPHHLTVFSKDNQEEKIPLKYIKSITLEKIPETGPASLNPKQEAKYSVRLENSQEIYTLRNKYTFSLNTNVGVVTRSIDPEIVNILSGDHAGTSKQTSMADKPLIQDKSIIFSLEFKF